jgi:hypothetical protein
MGAWEALTALVEDDEDDMKKIELWRAGLEKCGAGFLQGL